MNGVSITPRLDTENLPLLIAEANADAGTPSSDLFLYFAKLLSEKEHRTFKVHIDTYMDEKLIVPPESLSEEMKEDATKIPNEYKRRTVGIIFSLSETNKQDKKQELPSEPDPSKDSGN